MRASVVRLAILAYPRRWRRRYGLELEDLTVAVLTCPQTPARRLRIVAGLIVHGVNERVRRTESTRFKAAATCVSALLAGMFTLGGGLAADSVIVTNVQLATSVHIGPGVSLVRGNQAPLRSAKTGVTVLIPDRHNELITVGDHSAVVINTKSMRVTSITRVDGRLAERR